MSLLDCYAYINSADIGERLYGVGRLKYCPAGQAASLSECEERAKEAISGANSAVLLLKVP